MSPTTPKALSSLRSLIASLLEDWCLLLLFSVSNSPPPFSLLITDPSSFSTGDFFFFFFFLSLGSMFCSVWISFSSEDNSTWPSLSCLFFLFLLPSLLSSIVASSLLWLPSSSSFLSLESLIFLLFCFVSLVWLWSLLLSDDSCSSVFLFDPTWIPFGILSSCTESSTCSPIRSYRKRTLANK